MIRLGPVQKKTLLLLFGGVALGLSSDPRQSFRLIRGIRREWQEISRQTLERAVENLYKSELVNIKQKSNLGLEVTLTEKGKELAYKCNLESFHIKKPLRWDKKWRIVIFDIPEKEKVVREVFRGWLKRLSFYKLQNSVFVHPYDCRKEFKFLSTLHGVQKYVHFIVAEEIDNQEFLKRHFRL